MGDDLFVVGLLVGPVAAVVFLWLATVMGDVDSRLSRWGLVLILAVVLVLPAVAIELRLGLVMGGFLGMLLQSTPLVVDNIENG